MIDTDINMVTDIDIHIDLDFNIVIYITFILLGHNRETSLQAWKNNCHTVNCLWREPHWQGTVGGL